MNGFRTLVEISDFAATVAGLVLFAVGLTGFSGRTLNDTSIAIILLQPSGLGQQADQVYWFMLMLLGLGLVTLIWTRMFAMISLVAIIGKIIAVKYLNSPNMIVGQFTINQQAHTVFCSLCGGSCVLASIRHCLT